MADSNYIHTDSDGTQYRIVCPLGLHDSICSSCTRQDITPAPSPTEDILTMNIPPTVTPPQPEPSKEDPMPKLDDEVDPKQSNTTKKMNFNNVPISLRVLAVQGNDDGALKYGPWNWLKLPDGSMSVTTYINALERHLLLYRAGQDDSSDTHINNLDCMISGLAVVRDAMIFGKVHDDRIKLSEEQIIVLEKLLNQQV